MEGWRSAPAGGSLGVVETGLRMRPAGVCMSLDREFRIDITNDDIRLAKTSWLTAWESDAPNHRVSDLYEDYARLVSAQAQQIADDFRRNRRRRVD